MVAKPDASEMGRRGGLAATASQALARRKNILKALAKRHPASTVIQQQLQKLQLEEAAGPPRKER